MSPAMIGKLPEFISTSDYQPRRVDRARTQCRSCRSGFSLIELLVVIAVIGLLAALVIPAVQRARAAARRTMCVNNLKQLTLACLSYESTHRVLPPGSIVGTDGVSMVTVEPKLEIPSWPDDSRRAEIDRWYLSDNWSWHALILPQMDDPGTGIDTRDSKGTASNLTGIAVARSTFRCPDLPDSSEVFADAGGGSRIMLQFCSYRGNGGTNLRLSSPSGLVDDGVLFRDSVIRMGDIRDGASNTLLLVESAVGVWGDGLSASTRSADDNGDGKPDWGADGTSPAGSPSAFNSYWHEPGIQMSFSPGSWHEEIVHCSLADGSSRSLSRTMSLDVLQAIMTRAGQERVNVP